MIDWIWSQNCRNTLLLHTAGQLIIIIIIIFIIIIIIIIIIILLLLWQLPDC